LKTIKTVSILLIVCIVITLFIFGYNFWKLSTYKEINAIHVYNFLYNLIIAFIFLGTAFICDIYIWHAKKMYPEKNQINKRISRNN